MLPDWPLSAASFPPVMRPIAAVISGNFRIMSSLQEATQQCQDEEYLAEDTSWCSARVGDHPGLDPGSQS